MNPAMAAFAAFGGSFRHFAVGVAIVLALCTYLIRVDANGYLAAAHFNNE
jgi:hypothetical protein